MGEGLIVRRGCSGNSGMYLHIESLPTRTEFYTGETLDLTGLVVQAIHNDGTTETITDYTTTPADGTAIIDVGTLTVTIKYKGAEAYFNVSVASYKIVSWANGTDAEIAAMVRAADRGEINLSDYWSQGDTRSVELSSMAATGVGESHAAQTVQFVLEANTKFDLVTATEGGKTQCDFLVVLKGKLPTQGYMNSSNTTSGGWNSSKRRTWCNNVFFNALPETLREIFKYFKRPADKGSGSSSVQVSNDLVSIPSEYNIFGASGNGYAGSAEGTQFKYYQTAANRPIYAWECSTHSSTHFCRVGSSTTSKDYSSASANSYITVFLAI